MLRDSSHACALVQGTGMRGRVPRSTRRGMRSRVSALVRGAVLVSAGAAVALPLIGASVMRPSAQPLAAEVTRQLVTRLAGSGATVRLCRPGMPQDPCTAAASPTTVVQPSGAQSIVSPKVDATSRFDCFYVYPTVSLEASANADLKVQPAETSVADRPGPRFSTVCRVWAPMYRQVTSAGLQAEPTSTSPSSVIAYDSLHVGFEDYLARYNDGRPIIFIGHSQGATMLTKLARASRRHQRLVAQPSRARDHPRRQCRGAHRIGRGQFHPHPSVLEARGDRLRHRLLRASPASLLPARCSGDRDRDYCSCPATRPGLGSRWCVSTPHPSVGPRPRSTRCSHRTATTEGLGWSSPSCTAPVARVVGEQPGCR